MNIPKWDKIVEVFQIGYLDRNKVIYVKEIYFVADINNFLYFNSCERFEAVPQIKSEIF